MKKMITENQKQTIEQSCRILQFMSTCANVAKLYGLFILKKHLHIFMEKYNEGSLHHKMGYGMHITPELKAKWTNQMGSVCLYLAASGIVHR